MLSLWSILLILLALWSVALYFLARPKILTGKFFSDTHWLAWMGIYVWGDALVLAPAWLIAAVSFLWFEVSPQQALRWLLLFYLVRSAYEVMYWLNHQAVKSDYRPSFLRSATYLDAESVAIVYQLLHSVIVIACAGLLFL